jgi:hypothetical protein
MRSTRPADLTLRPSKIMNSLPAAFAVARVIVALIMIAYAAAAAGEPERLSPPEATRELRLSPTAVVPAPDGKRLHVACARARAALFLDPAARAVVRRVELPEVPSGLAISGDGANCS